jgi:DNA-directed RNA polymerase alpha subunit
VNDYSLDIWTNGSISPNEALESASQIIIDLFTLLINNKNINEDNQLEPNLNPLVLNLILILLLKNYNYLLELTIV